jgi:deoxyribonuclease-4
MRLGAHIGTSHGLNKVAATARSVGCEVVQIFSKSPQMWKGPPISDEVAAAFRESVRAEGLGSVAVHHCYLLNLASPKAALLKQSRRAIVDELQRAEKLGAEHLIFHPGAHTGSGADAGLALLSASLNWVLEQTPGLHVKALLENAAGAGSALCSTFPELRRALDGVSDRTRVGVALDSCHLFAAGYDLRTPESYGAVMDRLEAELGRREVLAFHVNDSKGEFGQHLDRHANIGQGKIGVEGFRPLVTDPTWRQTPGYLETPVESDDYSEYRADLVALRGLLGEPPRVRPAPPPPGAPAVAPRPRRKAVQR